MLYKIQGLHTGSEGVELFHHQRHVLCPRNVEAVGCEEARHTLLWVELLCYIVRDLVNRSSGRSGGRSDTLGEAAYARYP